MDGGRLRAVLVDNHLPDLFPDLDGEDRAHISAGGKIPDAKDWQNRVEDGTASWDGLLTEAAIASFAADQGELDARVRGLLG